MINHTTRMFFFFFLILVSCRKEESSQQAPDLGFVKQTETIWKDTILPMGASIKIDLFAKKSGENITYFNVKLYDGIFKTYLDSGLNSSTLNYSLHAVKSAAENEKWIFTIMDKARNKTNIEINIKKDITNNFGKIMYCPSVILNAQSNVKPACFLSFSDYKTYSLSEAYSIQNLMDLIYYYGIYNATLSSPNETDVVDVFTGQSGIATWTTKNETRYNNTAVTIAEFDKAQNDSLIIANYDQIAAKRKAKFVQNGQIIAFRNQAGKTGLIKIISLNGNDTGSLEIAFKIQQ